MKTELSPLCSLPSLTTYYSSELVTLNHQNHHHLRILEADLPSLLLLTLFHSLFLLALFVLRATIEVDWDLSSVANSCCTALQMSRNSKR